MNWRPRNRTRSWRRKRRWGGDPPESYLEGLGGASSGEVVWGQGGTASLEWLRGPIKHLLQQNAKLAGQGDFEHHGDLRLTHRRPFGALA